MWQLYLKNIEENNGSAVKVGPDFFSKTFSILRNTLPAKNSKKIIH